MIWAIGILCAIVGTYLYVMGLCYLCDLYELRKRKKQAEEEKRRKEELRRALDEAEMRRKTQIERRKQLARGRNQYGNNGIQRPSENPARRQATPAAGA